MKNKAINLSRLLNEPYVDLSAFTHIKWRVQSNFGSMTPLSVIRYQLTSLLKDDFVNEITLNAPNNHIHNLGEFEDFCLENIQELESLTLRDIFDIQENYSLDIRNSWTNFPLSKQLSYLPEEFQNYMNDRNVVKLYITVEKMIRQNMDR